MRFRVLLLVGFVLIACSESPGTVPGSDSRAELSEECRIDGHADTLVAIGRILVGIGDQVIVEQAQQSQVRFYDAGCERLGTFGREGQGPGEFSGMWGMGFVADTLWAWDPNQSRATLVSQDRELVRSFGLPRPIQSAPAEFSGFADALFPNLRGIRPDGHLIVEFLLPAGLELPDPYANQVILGAVTPEGQLEGLVAQVRHGGPIAYSTGTGGGTIPHPLRNPAIVVVSDHADQIASATATLEGDQAETFTVTLSDGQGTTIWTRTLPFDPIPLTPAVADSVLTLVQGMPAQFQAALREQVQVPPVYPPVSGLLIGRDDSVWIEMIVRDGVRPYLVLSADGEVVGTANLSERSRVAAAQLDRIWVTERDDLDVESIVTYSVSW